MRSAPVPRPSFTPSLIFTERESEVVGVRPTATGTSPCLITDTHTQCGPLVPTLNLMLCLSLSLSVARHHGNGKNGRKGRDEKKGMWGWCCHGNSISLSMCVCLLNYPPKFLYAPLLLFVFIFYLSLSLSLLAMVTSQRGGDSFRERGAVVVERHRHRERGREVCSEA